MDTERAIERTERISAWLEEVTGLSPVIQAQIAASLATILVLWILRVIVLRFALPKIEDIRAKYRFRKTTDYIAVLIGVLVIGRVWFEGFQSLTVFLGLLTAGLAIALKDPIVNVAGWLFILWRKPFEVGDRIEVGDDAGDVIDLRLFQFTLMEIGNWVHADQSTGRVIHVPNGKVFYETLANYSKGFQYIWNEIPVVVTFESNWREAKGILQKLADTHAEHIGAAARKKVEEAARKFMILYSKLTPKVYTKVIDFGVQLTIRYLCEPRKRRSTEEAIWEDILEEFARRTDIDFAYPTQRFYNNLREGKKDARADPALSDD